MTQALIEAFHRFKAASLKVDDAGWNDFNARAKVFVEKLDEAGLESHKQAALTYWQAAGRRTLCESLQSKESGCGDN